MLFKLMVVAMHSVLSNSLLSTNQPLSCRNGEKFRGQTRIGKNFDILVYYRVESIACLYVPRTADGKPRQLHELRGRCPVVSVNVVP